MSSISESFRDGKTAKKLIQLIEELAGDRHIKIVHVCGTHEDAISRFGLRSILPRNVEVLMGPGCPVCTVPPSRIDFVIRLAKSGVIVTTFGDMMRVSANLESLADAKSRGADVRVVYSIRDAVKIAAETKREVVHFGIGFETTAPTTASELLAHPPENFSVYSAHILIPPAMVHLLRSGETHLDGFLDPGHVSAIIGEVGYRSITEHYKVPQVIAGFEPIDILISVAMICRQLNEGRGELENAYTRIVRPEGNPLAIRLLEDVFDIRDAPWRGIGNIPGSGLTIKKSFEDHDASKKFDLESEVSYEMPHGCRCGEILRAVCYPWDCPLFNKTCTPDSPVGPCMVSREGSCFISAKYGVDKP